VEVIGMDATELARLAFRALETGDAAAVRDDLGMMTQLGFIPPRPATAMRLLGMHLAGGARRSVREAVRRADQAARQAATTPTMAG
jgi:hypothetical protein